MTHKSYKSSLFLLVFTLFLLFFSINIAYASNPSDWPQYSPMNTFISNSQDPMAIGNFSGGISSTLNYIFTHGHLRIANNAPFAPSATQITTKFMAVGAIDKHYIVATDGNYLSVFDNELFLLNETLSGSQVYSLNLFSSGDTLGIYGIFLNTSNSQNFAHYAYNTTDNSLNLISLTQLPSSLHYFASQSKCVANGNIGFNYPGVSCAFTTKGAGSDGIQLNVFYDNGTITKSSSIGISPVEEASGISLFQYPGDNNYRVLFHTISGNIVVVAINGTEMWRYTGNYMLDAVLAKTQSNTYVIAYLKNPQAQSGVYKLGFFTLSGAEYGGSADTIYSQSGLEPGNIAVISNVTGGETLVIPFSNSTATIVKYYDTSKTLLKSATYPFPTTTSAIYVGGYAIASKLSGSNNYDVIIQPYIWNNNQTSAVVNGDTGEVMFYFRGQVVPVDINLAGTIELVGYNYTGLFILNSGFVPSNAVAESIYFEPDCPAVNANVKVYITASTSELTPLHYYADCGNGVIANETTNNYLICSYNNSGDYSVIGYVRDQYHSDYDSITDIVTIGSSCLVTTNSTIINSFVNPILSLFPEASTLSLGQKAGIVLIVMLLTAIILLFAGSQISRDGLSSLIIWVVLIVLVAEFIFFIAIQYVPIGFLIILVLFALAISYLKFRGNGG